MEWMKMSNEIVRAVRLLKNTTWVIEFKFIYEAMIEVVACVNMPNNDFFELSLVKGTGTRWWPQFSPEEDDGGVLRKIYVQANKLDETEEYIISNPRPMKEYGELNEDIRRT
jgi:hypothetical protein